MYTVYFCTGVEYHPDLIPPTYKPAEFDTLDDAIAYVNERVKGKRTIDERDNCIEGTSRMCWFEIYDGGLIVNPGTDEEDFRDPEYSSDYYYTDEI